MTQNRYSCPACGALTNSLRCPQCGTDTLDIRADDMPRESDYSIFDHAQRGHVCNTLTRAAHSALARRFTGAPLTGFGSLQ